MNHMLFDSIFQIGVIYVFSLCEKPFVVNLSSLDHCLRVISDFLNGFKIWRSSLLSKSVNCKTRIWILMVASLRFWQMKQSRLFWVWFWVDFADFYGWFLREIKTSWKKQNPRFSTRFFWNSTNRWVNHVHLEKMEFE